MTLSFNLLHQNAVDTPKQLLIVWIDPVAYQEYLVTFKLMTSQVIQRLRPLGGHVWLLGRQRVKSCVHI